MAASSLINRDWEVGAAHREQSAAQRHELTEAIFENGLLARVALLRHGSDFPAPMVIPVMVWFRPNPNDETCCLDGWVRHRIPAPRR